MLIKDELTGSELAHEIKERILRDPDKHAQSFWFRHSDHSDTRVPASFAEKPECGTTLCVAGWAAVLNGYDVGYSYTDRGVRHVFGFKEIQGVELKFEISELAADLLEIDENDADVLFTATTNDEAVEALSWLECGLKIEWDTINSELDDIAKNG